MIGFLDGILHSVHEDVVYVNVSGVGYEVLSSRSNLDVWTLALGQRLQIFIYTHVREDGIQLFGFSSQEEKVFFLSLLKVNGIGPKLALNVLSGGSMSQLIRMIEMSDAKALSQIPKVGKKTAEQMILTLKGKLVFVEKDEPKRARHQEVISALIHLGFKAQLAEEFVTTLPEVIEVEEGVRKGLQALTQISQKRN